MKILAFVKKVPGGLMVVPLLLGVLVATLIPQVLQVGGLTTALWGPAGAGTAIAISMFCVGSQIDIRQAGEVLKRSAVLLISKYAAGALVGIVIAKTVGMQGIMGISVVAIVAAITNSNGGLYMSLSGTYGDHKDVAAQSLLSINDGPFLTMLTVGVAGLANIPLMDLLAAVAPVLIGMILGNLDRDISEFLAPAVSILIPFFAFCLGAGISVGNLLKGGVQGIILGVACVAISGTVCILADRYINKRPGYAGASVSSVAGNAVGTPALLAAAAPSLLPFQESATVQVASAVIVTVVLVPILTAWTVKKWGDGKTFDAKKSEKKQKGVPSNS